MTTLSNWMSLVPDATLLSDVNIPGSRQSMSYLLSESDPDHVQNRSLSGQLEVGARAFHIDLTVWPTHNSGYKWQRVQQLFVWQRQSLHRFPFDAVVGSCFCGLHGLRCIGDRYRSHYISDLQADVF